MNITLANIVSYNKEVGEDNGFFADLYIDDKHVGHAKKEGPDSPTMYRPISNAGSILINEAEDYCQSLPGSIITLSRKINIEFLQHEVIQQGERKLRCNNHEQEQKSIIVFHFSEDIYRCLDLKIPIQSILAAKHGERTIMRILDEFIFPHLRPKDVVLNRNLPQTILRVIFNYCSLLKNSAYAQLHFGLPPELPSSKKKGR